MEKAIQPIQFNKIGRAIIVFFAIAVGLYPIIYYLVDIHDKGLLQSKPDSLLHDTLWHTLFYVHITFGGLALLTGWSQFSTKLRAKYLRAHKLIGKVYLISVLLSGLAGLYIAFYATGGVISKLGFGTLAVIWVFSPMMAYVRILQKNIPAHQNWMLRNYALTFAAVTLRIWLPFSQIALHLDFMKAYHIAAWLCWLPNLLFAEVIIYIFMGRKGYEGSN
jgi:hypothetical protein